MSGLSVDVGAPRERAEGRRHAPDLDVEIRGRPRPDAQVEPVRADAVAVFGLEIAQPSEVLVRPSPPRDTLTLQHPQRRVFVIGVIEERGVFGAKVAETLPPIVTWPSAKTRGSAGSV